MKKVLSLSLVLMLCLSLAVPALGADLDVHQISDYDYWGDGPSLTISGVVDRKKTELELSDCIDVAVGGSMVLELDFPEGRNRTYTFMMTGVYIPTDLKSPPSDEDMAFVTDGWEIAPDKMAYDIDETDGRSQYVYNFTADEVGEVRNHYKAIYMSVYWDDDPDSNGEADAEGSAYFYLRVVPAESGEPSTPSAPQVQLSSQNVTVDGKAVSTEAYNIDGSNYFKLRDMAMMLSGTGARFSVGYDGTARTISVKGGEAYVPVGGELETGTDKSSTCVESTQSVVINGKAVSLSVYNIGGNNFFKLRDLGEALSFGVDYDAATRTAAITTK